MKEESEPHPEALEGKPDLSLLALCSFILAVPWLYEGTTDQHRARVILASLPFLLLSLVHLRRLKIPALFDRTARLGGIAIFVGLVVSAILAERSTIAWLRVLELCWAGSVVYCVACYVVNRPKGIIYIIAAIAGAYCISNIRLYIEWIQTPGDPRARDWTFAIPGYFHFRNLGFAAAPALVVFAWLPFCKQVQELSDTKKRLSVLLLWVVATVGWGVLGWSGSRAGVLSAFVGIGALAYFTKGRLPWGKLFTFSLSSCVVGAGISIPFTPLQGGSWGALRIVGRVATASSGSVDSYSSGRLTVWLDGLSRWAENWLWGIGPDQYASQPQLPNRLLEPHNAVVDVALESGVLGLLGFVLVVVFVFRLLKLSKRGELLPIIASLVLSYGVYSMVDGTLVWTLPLAYISVLLGTFFGVSAKEGGMVVEKRPVGRFVLPSLSAVTLLSSIVFCFVHFQAFWLRDRVPSQTSFEALSLYRFPATTWGANNWLSEWERRGEGDLDSWYKMLIDESPAPYFYRIEYGYYLIRQNRLVEAKDELESALDIAPLGVRPGLEKKHGPVLRKLDAVL